MIMAKIELKAQEALVLIDFLLRFRDNESLSIEHHAEECILWDVCALLESQVPELLAKDYRTQLKRARSLVANDDYE
jgi:hypothetical protein